MKIYTKTGDDGSTGLFGGRRVSKYSVRIRTYGEVDELNSVLGLARSSNLPPQISELLEAIQADLFALGSDMATPMDVQSDLIRRIETQQVAKLEEAIDRMEASLPSLTSFILPGGSPAGAFLHLARTVCRRAERSAVELSQVEEVNPVALIFLNRLSDLLFVAARVTNHSAGCEETKWTQR